ncbi:MAG TPA: hypothetical protein VJH55_03930 [Candidatus Paceibacterota bacterium]
MQTTQEYRESTEEITAAEYRASPVQIARAKKRMSSTLFPRWMLDDSTNVKYMEFLREADAMFQAYPDYVGLAPYGSRFKGSAHKNSDFDIILIAGDSNVYTQNYIRGELEKLATKINIRCGTLSLYSEEYFEGNFKLKSNPHPGTVYSHAAWVLLNPHFLGRPERLSHLRRLARAKHAELQEVLPRGAENNFRDTIGNVLFWEFHHHVELNKTGLTKVGRIKRPDKGLKKLYSRGFSQEDIEEVIEAREKLWRKEAEKLLLGI